MNNLARFLRTDHVRPVTIRPRRTLRQDLARFWAWCLVNSHGGWVAVIAVVIILTVLFARQVNDVAAAALRQCAP